MSERLEIERDQKFKDSLLWKLQEAAYTQFGPEAWANKGVPFYLTSNPLIAKQFALVIQNWLSDPSLFDFSQPIYLFDLGAGSGRLAFLMLKHLLPLLDKKIKIRYVMTDIVEKNIDFWQEHPLLRPYLNAGIIDFAFYHHSSQSPLKLIESGQTLDVTVNPVALICTYFFDTIPQDLYRVEQGLLKAGSVTLTVPSEGCKDFDPAWIKDLTAKFRYDPIESEDPVLNDYWPSIGECSFLFPAGAFETIRFFSELSRGKLLVLAADQGVATPLQVYHYGEPKISKHASFSIAVNYHAIAYYFKHHGGKAFFASDPNPKFMQMAAMLGASTTQRKKVEEVFRESIDFLQPVEYWELTNLSSETCRELSLEQLLILVKLGNFDPVNLYAFFEPIREKMSAASPKDKDFLLQVIERCLENFYNVSNEEGDFIMNMGVLLFEMEHYDEALRAFAAAEKLKGEDRQLLLNQAHCHKLLGQHLKAAVLFQRALKFS